MFDKKLREALKKKEDEHSGLVRLLKEERDKSAAQVKVNY